MPQFPVQPMSALGPCKVMLLPRNSIFRMAELFTSGSAVTGNMEMRNLVHPYGTSVTGSAGFRPATGTSGRRGAFGSGFQATSTSIGPQFQGRAQRPVPPGGHGPRSTVKPGFCTSSANCHRAEGSGVLASGVSGMGSAKSRGP